MFLLVDGIQHKNFKKNLKTLLTNPASSGCGQRKSLVIRLCRLEAVSFGGSLWGFTIAAGAADAGGSGRDPRAMLEGWAGGGNPELWAC